MPMQKYGGRKFVLAMVGLLVWSLLLVFGFLDKSSYVVLCMGTVAAYITGNVAQKATAGGQLK